MLESQSSSTATAFLARAVGWHWRHVLNASNLQTVTGQGSQRSLCSRTRRLGSVSTSGSQLDVHGIDSNFLSVSNATQRKRRIKLFDQKLDSIKITASCCKFHHIAISHQKFSTKTNKNQ
jgi:hypothetical protein